MSRRARRRRRAAVTTATRAALLGLLAFGVAQAATVHQAAEAPLALAEVQADSGLVELRDGLDSSRATVREGTVTLIADGSTTTLPLAGGTLGDTLAAAGVTVGVDDIVSAHLGTPIGDGETVMIQRVGTEIVTETALSGRDSESTQTFQITTVDGVETSRSVLAATETLGTLDSAIAAGDNVEVGRILAAQNGWTGDQWQCLYNLWQKESRWLTTADNPTSSAYGIPQALPGRKMASAGEDWATNPATQITWGIGYIEDRYGTPCGAWGHSQSHNWY